MVHVNENDILADGALTLSAVPTAGGGKFPADGADVSTYSKHTESPDDLAYTTDKRRTRSSGAIALPVLQLIPAGLLVAIIALSPFRIK
jgi:hypothetical protein